MAAASETWFISKKTKWLILSHIENEGGSDCQKIYTEMKSQEGFQTGEGAALLSTGLGEEQEKPRKQDEGTGQESQGTS